MASASHRKPLPIIVILGPTASGKTEVSLRLADYFNIEIISADSRQLYRHLDIGTATPTEEELSRAPHHFVSCIDPDEYYSAGQFGEDAWNAALEIAGRGNLPVVVGGSGLYIKALCEGLFGEGPSKTRFEVREILTKRFETEGIEPLYEELKKVDPKSAELYDDRNPRRIIRALEYWHTHGRAFSEAHEEFARRRNADPLYFAIDYPRDELYGRINRRAEMMWDEGLLDEVERVLEMGYSPKLNSLNTVGYKEAIAYLEGKIDRESAVELMKRNTRRYAKRQLTWFRRYEDIVWLSGEPAAIARRIFESFGHAHPEIPVK
ncbi:MAG: tRNA (adenosine(37)-N6)-dimethylallyltransferase MiaA [Candidatus Kapaibacterium sp.]